MILARFFKEMYVCENWTYCKQPFNYKDTAISFPCFPFKHRYTDHIQGNKCLYIILYKLTSAGD